MYINPFNYFTSLRKKQINEHAINFNVKFLAFLGNYNLSACGTEDGRPFLILPERYLIKECDLGFYDFMITVSKQINIMYIQ